MGSVWVWVACGCGQRVSMGSVWVEVWGMGLGLERIVYSISLCIRVGVLRDELSGQDEEKVKKKMEARPVQESNEVLSEETETETEMWARCLGMDTSRVLLVQLWDVLERKSKGEILDMLLDRDEETERLRQYVDTVTTVVMMQAPELFEEISKSSSGVRRGLSGDWAD